MVISTLFYINFLKCFMLCNRTDIKPPCYSVSNIDIANLPILYNRPRQETNCFNWHSHIGDSYSYFIPIHDEITIL